MVFSLVGRGARPQALFSSGARSAAVVVGSVTADVATAVERDRAGNALDGFDSAVTSNKFDTVNFDHDTEDGDVKSEEEDTVDGHDQSGYQREVRSRRKEKGG